MTHRTPKKDNPGAGGRGAMRRAHAAPVLAVISPDGLKLEHLDRWRSCRRKILASQGYVSPDVDRVIADEEEQRARLDRAMSTQLRTPIDLDDVGHGPHLSDD